MKTILTISLFSMAILANSVFKINNSDIDIHSEFKNNHTFRHTPLTAGLPPSLSKVNRNLKNKGHINMLYLIYHEPETNLNLDSTKILIRNLFKMDKFDTGHMQIAWSCKINDRLFESATGFNGDLSNQGFRLAKKGFYLSPILARFHDGMLETPRQVQSEILKSLNQSRLSLIGIDVEKKCEEILKNIWSFFNSSENSEFQLAQRTSKNTSKAQNCTTSIFEWLSPLSIIKAIERRTQRELNIPNKYFGFPRYSKERLPSFPSFITHQKNKSKQTKIWFYDPNLLMKELLKVAHEI